MANDKNHVWRKNPRPHAKKEDLGQYHKMRNKKADFGCRFNQNSTKKLIDIQ